MRDVNARACNVANLDRVGVIIDVDSDKVFIIPKDHAEYWGVRKAKGKQALGFMSKHDLNICMDGSVLSLHSVLRDKSLPKGEVIKLQVHSHFVPLYICLSLSCASCLSVRTPFHRCHNTHTHTYKHTYTRIHTHIHTQTHRCTCTKKKENK